MTRRSFRSLLQAAAFILVVILTENSNAAPTLNPLTGALPPPPVVAGGQLGTSHVASRYDPFGSSIPPTILTDGARDAYSMGFKTIKVWMHLNEISIPTYYSFSPSMLAGVQSLRDVAQMDAYQRLFDMPFQTFFLSADDNPTDIDISQSPLTPAHLTAIYNDIYNLTSYLLSKYRGSYKIFIIENHEADWHILSNPADTTSPDSDVGLANYRAYFRTRQQAVNDARLAANATDVYVYHMCEVVRVRRSWDSTWPGNQRGPSVASDVLPYVDCDLIGYSAYESMLDATAMRGSVNYLKQQSRPGSPFGGNNVVVSEIGIPENIYSSSQVSSVGSIIENTLFAGGIPWVLLWELYDNECSPQTLNNASASQCKGFWIRKPDGSFGQLFQQLQHHLLPPGGNCNQGYYGANDLVGLSNGDPRFLCENDRWYDCGWESNDPSWESKVANGQHIGNYICDLSSPAWRKPLVSQALFISQSVPRAMTPGQAYPVSVTLQNIGTETWTNRGGNPFRLGSQNPQDNGTWGGRVDLNSGETVPPGAKKTFSFYVRAPDAPGDYHFQWRMLQEGVKWFGDFTPDVIITVGTKGIATLNLTFSQMTAFHGACNSSVPLSSACMSASSRACTAAGFLSGFGPVEYYGNNATIECVSATVAAAQSASFQTLSAYQSACNAPAAAMGLGCNAAVNRFCQAAGFATGLAITEYSADTADFSCLKSSGAAILTDSWSTLSAYHGLCSLANQGIPGACLTASDRDCRARGYEMGFGVQESAGSIAQLVCL